MGYQLANRKEGTLPPGINWIWQLNSLGGLGRFLTHTRCTWYTWTWWVAYLTWTVLLGVLGGLAHILS
jgi:hypothetical protein